jgi:hypothetical protein
VTLLAQRRAKMIEQRHGGSLLQGVPTLTL